PTSLLLSASAAAPISPLSLHDALPISAPGQSAAPIALATCVSCSRAAGRYTSVDTKIGRCPCWVSHLASLPVVVVLPEPCRPTRSEEHTSELQSHLKLVCRLLLEKKNK